MTSVQSLRALDWLNFFVADVQMGFGPFIASYLAAHKWTQGEIGLMLSVGTITAMVSKVPAGAMVDALSNKKGAAAAAILAITFSAVLLALSPTWLPVVAAEVFHGFASCMLVPAMAAIALALVGRRALSARLGRNARWASIGGALAAGLMGLIGQYLSVRAIFWLTAALSLPALIALSMIRLPSVGARVRRAGPGTFAPPAHQAENLADASRAARAYDRPATPTADAAPAVAPRLPLSVLLRDRRLLGFALCVVLFHLSNAAMLNLAAGEVTTSMGGYVQLVIAACIIVPQGVVAALSPWVGRSAERFGRRPILLLGFSALPARALLFAGISNPYLLVPIQLFDGLSAAVFGVMLPLVAADIGGDKGRYNLCIGIFGLAAGLGATLSTTLAGFAADRFGQAASFLGLAAFGALAVTAVWAVLPETGE